MWRIFLLITLVVRYQFVCFFNEGWCIYFNIIHVSLRTICFKFKSKYCIYVFTSLKCGAIHACFLYTSIYSSDKLPLLVKMTYLNVSSNQDVKSLSLSTMWVNVPVKHLQCVQVITPFYVTLPLRQYRHTVHCF